MDKNTLKRMCLALAAGATLLQTSSCTATDLLSVIGVGSIVGYLLGAST